MYKEIKIVGIYFLYRDNKLIYIGQTTDLHSRLASHRSAATTKFDYFRLIPCSRFRLKHYESRLIAYFKPELNRPMGTRKRKDETRPFKKIKIQPLTPEQRLKVDTIIFEGLDRLAAFIPDFRLRNK